MLLLIDMYGINEMLDLIIYSTLVIVILKVIVSLPGFVLRKQSTTVILDHTFMHWEHLSIFPSTLINFLLLYAWLAPCF